MGFSPEDAVYMLMGSHTKLIKLENEKIVSSNKTKIHTDSVSAIKKLYILDISFKKSPSFFPPSIYETVELISNVNFVSIMLIIVGKVIKMSKGPVFEI